MTTALSSILVLAPHPDDEVVGAAIAMKRAIAQGACLSVLFLTTGIAQEAWFWERNAYRGKVAKRMDEARQVADAGGFKIAGSLDIPSRRLIEHLDEARQAIERLKAQQLWVPAYEGGHQDHDVANALAQTLRDRFEILEFAEYNFANKQVNSNQFPDGAGNVLDLSPEDDVFKRALLGLYASERANLDYVSCRHEAMRPLPAHDYARPPHQGRLFRERFHWVPFRHPRIDWRSQAEINGRLSAFVSRFS
ncbi:conserved hypothetical protein [Rhodospirillaceae bacterium LM-1]|nr:conserved hypothetical protein [Rhodospirillaceae bacterium LM-1]